jgi:hypothetical protein
VVPTKVRGKENPKRTKPRDNPIVRNSYSLPKQELDQLTRLVKRLRFTKNVKEAFKKSEIVRIGLQLANDADVDELLTIRERIGILQVGRRGKNVKAT